MAAQALPWITIALQAEPEALALGLAIKGLFAKHPNLTPDQVNAMVAQIVSQQADPVYNAVLAKVAADQGKTA